MAKSERGIKALFDLSEIEDIVTSLKHDRDSTFNIFEENGKHKESYFAAKAKLEEFINKSKSTGSVARRIRRDMDELYKRIAPVSECDIATVLRWYLRYCHIGYMINTEVEFDINTETEDSFRTMFVRLIAKFEAPDYFAVTGLLNMAIVLWTKTRFSMPVQNEFGLTNFQDINDSSSSSSQSKNIVTTNKLIDHTGFFSPLDTKEHNFMDSVLLFNFENLVGIGKSGNSLVMLKGHNNNEALVEDQMHFIIQAMIHVFGCKFRKFTCTPQPTKKLSRDGKSFSVIPDLEILVKMGNDERGGTLEIPMECKCADIGKYYKTFSVKGPLSPTSFNFTKLFSQVVREAVVSNTPCGFMFNHEIMYFINFRKVIEEPLSRNTKLTATRIETEFFSINYCSDFLKAILYASEHTNENFKESVLEATFVLKGIKSKLGAFYHTQISSVYESIKCKIINTLPKKNKPVLVIPGNENNDNVDAHEGSSEADKDIDMITEINPIMNENKDNDELHEGSSDAINVSQMRVTEVNSSSIWADSSLVEDIDMIEMKKTHFRLLLKLAKKPKWKFQNFQEIKAQFQIEVLQGKLNEFNSCVLKLTRNNDDKDVSILKLLDPVFSKTHKNREDFTETFTDSLAQFLTEIYCYDELEKESFTPSIINFGIMQNNCFEYQERVNPENPSISGFYIHMQYIQGETLNKLPQNQKVKYEPILKECLRRMHAHNVYHRDLTSTNIIIAVTGECFIIDYGFAKYYLKRYKDEVIDPKLTKAEFDLKALNRAIHGGLSTIDETEENEAAADTVDVCKRDFLNEEDDPRTINRNISTNTPTTSQLEMIVPSHNILHSSSAVEGSSSSYERKKPKLQ